MQQNTLRSGRLIDRICARWQLYLMLLLPVAYILIFAYYPMAGLQIAFKKFNYQLGIWGSPWVGLRYFERFFKSYQFGRVLRNTLSLSFYGLLASFPLPIILALMLNALPLRRYKKFVQTTTYIPHFISTVVMVGIVLQLFNPTSGIFASVYKALTGNAAPNIMGIAGAFPHVYVWSGVWQSTGWSSIIFVAALSGVDEQLHEAAQIDGASRFKRVLHIDLQAILPTASIMLILNVGSIMNVGFEKAFLLQNSLNLSTSEVISTYVYKVGLVTGGGDFSSGTAIGMFNSVVNFALIVFVNAICGRLGGATLW